MIPSKNGGERDDDPQYHLSKSIHVFSLIDRPQPVLGLSCRTFFVDDDTSDDPSKLALGHRVVSVQLLGGKSRPRIEMPPKPPKRQPESATLIGERMFSGTEKARTFEPIHGCPAVGERVVSPLDAPGEEQNPELRWV